MEAGTASAGGTGAPPRLKPLDAGQTIDAALNLYTKNAVQLWQLVATVIVPITVIDTILRLATLPSHVSVSAGTLHVPPGTSTTAADIAYLVTVLFWLFGQLLATGAVFKLQLDAYLGRPHTIRESLEFAVARHRLLSLLWVGIIAAVMVLVGLIFVIAPGVYLFVATSVAVPVLMLEGQKGMGAISRSINLVSRLWGPTAGRLLIGLTLYVVAYFLIREIAGAIAHVTTSASLVLVIDGIVSLVITIVLAPFIAALVNVIYIDLRVRKEAVDHGVLLAGGPPSGTPAGVEPLPPDPS